MSGTYTWPQVVNGKIYNQSDFSPYGYATTLPDLLGNFAAQAASAQGAVQAANAAASAAAAATSAAQAADRVAGVTAGSTANLVYPEAVANLGTAADVRDVFIYDTRLDSDGGAWRMQCQHTSWYQEALNTATRGAKREFPAVALIVLRLGALTIYDLHDLDSSGAPRMWMVFNGGFSNHLFISGGSSSTSVAALNGYILVLTTGGSGSGRVHRISLTGDTTVLYSSFNTARWSGPIGARNSGANSATVISPAAIVNNDCSQVAMRVLPGALRDGAGLPIPTIAVATSGGISVIHPDGRVFSLTVAGGYRLVSFVSDTHIGGVFEADSTAPIYYPIPYATAAESGARAAVYYSTGGAINYIIGGHVALSGNAAGGVSGLAQFAHEIATNPSTGMVAVAAQTHATGWQPGDIRLAALCDGRTGALAGDIRLALDGTSVVGFASVNSGTVTSTGGRIRIARNGVNDPGGSIALSGLTVGETYTVDFDALIGTAGNWLVAVNSAVTLFVVSGTADAAGQRAQFVADQTTATLALYAITSTGTNYAEFDNITIRAGVADRSYRARGFHAIGSLSRAPVGTGNDVVAFSGFSASNYLEQPYSSLLDFGTGDFSVAFWGRASSGSGYYLERDSLTTGARLSLLASSNKISLSVSDGTNSASIVSTADFVASENALWHFVRRGSVLEIWRNGVLDASGSIGSVGSLTNTTARLRVGERVSASSPATGLSVAMLRIAAYAPTPAQIARMYRDEAPLFDAGGKAFLGGTSSAVNDLSFSEQSRRLAVATADGVSIFSGLRRVEYLSTGNLSPAMGANNTSKVALEAGALMVGTTANAGVRRDAITGLDRMQAAPRAPFSPRRITARGVTTDATPLALAPRLHIGERETLIVQATIVGRVFGASDGQRIGYQRRATYYRDAGGNVTLQGSVQTIGIDTEVTGTADATLLIDTTAQTVTPQVTGVASTRIVWTVTLETTRIADAQYEETV
jgi:hypothetical protein